VRLGRRSSGIFSKRILTFLVCDALRMPLGGMKWSDFQRNPSSNHPDGDIKQIGERQFENIIARPWQATGSERTSALALIKRLRIVIVLKAMPGRGKWPILMRIDLSYWTLGKRSDDQRKICKLCECTRKISCIFFDPR
jgi:hypothetical protein